MSDDTLGRVIEFLMAKTWDDVYTQLKHDQDVLLSADAEDFILGRIKAARTEDDLPDYLVPLMEQRLVLIRNCRAVGVDRAMNEIELVVPPSEADFEAVKAAIEAFPKTAFTYGWYYVSSAQREALERDRALLLTDTADRICQHYVDTWPANYSDGNPFAKYQRLFRRARAIGVDRAWREDFNAGHDDNDDWDSYHAWELFDRWVGMLQDDKGATYSAHREARRFLEQHAGTMVKPHLLPYLLKHIADINGPGSIQFRMIFISNYLDGIYLYRYLLDRGVSVQAIRDAYVDLYGGLVLDTPAWFEDVTHQLDDIRRSNDDDRTRAARRIELIKSALERAQEEQDIAPETFTSLYLELIDDAVRYRDSWTNLAPSEVLEDAIDAYAQAIDAFIPERFPFQFASCQFELARLYDIDETRQHNDRNARVIQCLELALHHLRRHDFNKECDRWHVNNLWANSQLNLGVALDDRAEAGSYADRADLDRAREAYESALLAYTPGLHPERCRSALLNLAWLHYNGYVTEAKGRQDEQAVLDAYERAHVAFVRARQVHAELGWLTSDPGARGARVIGRWSGPREMYARDAWCSYVRGQYREAAIALESGRAQVLSEAQAIAGASMEGVCEDHATQFIQARKLLDKKRIEGPAEEIQKARKGCLSLREEIRKHCNAGFLPGEADYADIVSSAWDTTIVYITATDRGGMALAIPPIQGMGTSGVREPLAIALPRLTERVLNNWLVRTDADQRIVGGYRFAIEQRATDLLTLWTLYHAGGDGEQERRRRLRFREVHREIPDAMSTLKDAIVGMIDAWQHEADRLDQGSQQQREKARSMRARLELTVADVLEQGVLRADLNWWLLQKEIERLLPEMSETFVIDLRKALDEHGLAGRYERVAIIPCGRLGVVPIHAAWARRESVRDDRRALRQLLPLWRRRDAAADGDLVPLAETCELTYQASARTLAMSRNFLAALPLRGPVLAIGDPADTGSVPLPWSEAEADGIVAVATRAQLDGSKALIGSEATLERVHEELRKIREARSGAWLQVATHGCADPSDPANCYMMLAHGERLTLADLQRQQLLRGTRLFNASGCVTALSDVDTAPDELGSFAAGVLQSGTPCAVATLWSVSDQAMFLLMLRFAQHLLGGATMSPAAALREASRWLRTATRQDLERLARAGSAGLRPLSSNESRRSIETMRGVTRDAERMAPSSALELVAEITPASASAGAPPYSHPVFWAAAVVYGA